MFGGGRAYSMTFEKEDQSLVKGTQTNSELDSESMVNVVTSLRLPWRFTDAMTEHTYKAKRGAASRHISKPKFLQCNSSLRLLPRPK